MRPAIFVATRNSLKPAGGGVQLCTNDYLELLRQHFDIRVIGFDTDRRWRSRFANLLIGGAYRRQVPSEVAFHIEQAIRDVQLPIVTFNLIDFPREAEYLRYRFGQRVRIVHLSHGLASTDVAIVQRQRRAAIAQTGVDRKAARELGGLLQFEMDYRKNVDVALCLSPLDAELERWLGAKASYWFPRVVKERALPARPVNRRIGVVGTLDHPPNRYGLEQFCEAVNRLGECEMRLRLVGTPEPIGRDLAKRFAFVEFVGGLDDQALRAEASTWCCFVHPIFSYARGCSTKIAVALGWGLPIATTVVGVRGYYWDQSIAPLASSPDELAKMTIERSSTENFAAFALQSANIRGIQPKMAEVASKMADAINSYRIV